LSERDRYVHDAVVGQVIDEHVDELDLTSARGPAGQETGEGFLRGTSVQTDQRADEQAKPWAVGLRAGHVVQRAGAASRQDAFQLLQVGRRQRGSSASTAAGSPQRKTLDVSTKGLFRRTDSGCGDRI
jgi:hypothetical protein